MPAGASEAEGGGPNGNSPVGGRAGSATGVAAVSSRPGWVTGGGSAVGCASGACCAGTWTAG